jgi:DNA-binding NtrC family response regulator
MVEIVEEIGAKVTAFDSADDAVTHLLRANEKCCLAIVDHSLPGQIQGIEFVEMVISRWPDIKAILTSGFFDRSRSGARISRLPAQTMVAG